MGVSGRWRVQGHAGEQLHRVWPRPSHYETTWRAAAAAATAPHLHAAHVRRWREGDVDAARAAKGEHIALEVDDALEAA
eukprot:1209534-Prymnesium_polylepis.1